MKKHILHFLHIPKTGGTAIKEALKDVIETEKYLIRLHMHKTRLMDIPEGEKAFFFLRDPVARFVSGFNSRLRQGKPRYNSPWNEGERTAFLRFPTATNLAEALFDPLTQNWAGQAMADIRHVNQSYDYWFKNIEYISSRKNDLIVVGFQEAFSSEFEILKKMLQLPKNIRLPKDDFKAHKTPQGYDTFLSDKAVVNLKRWYCQDYEFIELIKKYKNPILDQGTVDMTAKHVKKNDPQDMSQPDLDANGLMALGQESDMLLELTQYWAPPVPYWQPVENIHNYSNLRMACVVGDKLYHSLRFEGEVMLLTPSNWTYVLKYGRPDFLLMESTWSTATGHWYMGMSVSGTDQDALKEMLSYARNNNIPTVFWFTWDTLYHEHFVDIVSLFDFVFCADSREIDVLNALGIKADLLLPAIQPKIYNPFRLYEPKENFNIGVLYDGWADLDKFRPELNALESIKHLDLSIIDSRNIIFSKLREEDSHFQSFIKGCVNEAGRIMALKYTRIAVTLEPSRLSQTVKQWMALETAAVRVPHVHFGEIPDDDVRNEIVHSFNHKDGFIDTVSEFSKNDNSRERAAQLAWRAVNSRHLFSHRLRDISKRIGIHYDWNEFPKTTMITPTNRKELINLCIDRFDAQSYPNKELIIVYNSNNEPPANILEIIAQRCDIKILTAPEEVFTGGAMNLGIIEAKGDFCCKMDDDDIYGENYIGDLILHARGVDFDIFGKYPRYYYYKSDSSVYCSKLNTSLCIFRPHEIEFGNAWLAGNSIAGRRDVLKKLCFNSHAYGSADSQLIFKLKSEGENLSLAILDNLNMAIVRQADSACHTWKASETILKKRQSPANISLEQIFV